MTLKSQTDAVAGVLAAKRAQNRPTGRVRPGGSPVTDPTVREFLRSADPVLREASALRALAERFRDGERWRPYRSLTVSYLFASEFEKGT